MKNYKYFNWTIGLLIVILGCAFLCFQVLIRLVTEMEKKNTIVSSSYAVYEFDPATILDALRKEKEVFAKVTEEQGEMLYGDLDYYKITMPPINWEQEDYMKIANEAVFQFTGISFTDWNLNFLLFRMACTDAELGPQGMGLTLFRNGPAEDEVTELNIDIYPRSGQIGLRKLFYSPYTSGQGYVPFEKILVSFEEAFAISEENGGYSTRQSINNDCYIFVSYVASKDDHWTVNYLQNSDNMRIFEIWIDEETEEYKIIRSP
jgi:hypothetical protein